MIEHAARGIPAAFSSYFLHLYIPVPLLSLYAEQLIFGQLPAATHAINLLLHLATTGLVIYALQNVFHTNRWIALVTGLLWGLHPIHVETVLWAAGRKDLLLGFFFLLTITLQRKHSRFAFPVYILACLSKASAVTIPVLLLPVERIKKLVPYFIVAFVTGIVALASGGQTDLLYTLYTFPKAFILPLLHIVFPYELSPIYTDSYAKWFFLLFAAFLLMLGYAWKHQKKTVVFAFMWYAISITPSLLNKNQHTPYITTDHYAYIPSLAIIYLCVLGLWHVRWRSILIAAITIIFITRTYLQTHIWRTTDTLFMHVIEQGIKSDTAYIMLGNTLFDRGHTDEAQKAYNKAVTIRPTTRAYYLLGKTAIANNDLSSAISLFYKALETNTTMEKGERLYADLGALLLIQGNPESVFYLQKALEINPHLEEARENLKTAHERLSL